MSLFREITVSSDDNIVEAVPSNIRPKKAQNILMTFTTWDKFKFCSNLNRYKNLLAITNSSMTAT